MDSWIVAGVVLVVCLVAGWLIYHRLRKLTGPGTGFVGAPGGTCKEVQDEDQQQAAGEQERRRKYHCAHDV
jgi:hypothetical protein